MTGVLAFLPVRLALVIEFAGIRLRQRFRRITRALVSQPPGPHALFTELQRIESDPAYRARFLTGLDAAILRRDAEHTAELHAVEAAARLLRHFIHPGPGERTAAATDTTYVAEVTMTTGTTPRPVPLGRITAPNRRLALRWLRTQALRLADGHGHLIPPDATPWARTGNHVRQVAFHSTDAPESLRAWATDDQHQAHALHHLETRPHTPLLTVTDPATGLHLHLTGRPARPPRTARQLKEEPCLS
ncbi:hypothetical protein OHA98_34890 [Streptomyces sp. NBC_00654]|uniref:hypothetical protein n=1 Tax=Streptomyces sp. NBC_00654 TaxID=2975799 RepID=UPI002255D183|nr:hypothetical protein [Streptomyces sp. NBC_00654]MCX4969853.1 hypothetical protein [Streptomyces sp. NBC_00654]